MKKRVCCIISAIACVICISLFFSSCINSEPVNKLEFENETEIILNGENDSETIALRVYPANGNCSSVQLVFDKENYIEIEDSTQTIVIGADYCIVNYKIKPLYNGTVIVSAKSDEITSSNTVKITVENVAEKPITDDDEKFYLQNYGWNLNKISSFVIARKEIGMSALKEILSSDRSTYEFINASGDTCKVIFIDDVVSEIFDCQGERKIYPSDGKYIIYASDITTAMKVDLQTLAISLVKAKLVSPATADFPLFDWGYTLETSTTNCVVVISYVDSQNVFGATIRQNFAINFLCNADGEYIWSAMLLGDQYYFNSSLIEWNFKVF